MLLNGSSKLTTRLGSLAGYVNLIFHESIFGNELTSLLETLRRITPLCPASYLCTKLFQMKYLALILLMLCSMGSQAQLTFDPATLIASESGIVTVYAEDLDGDGDYDLLSTATNNGVRWWSNDGSGIFTEAQYLQQNGAEAQSKAAALADYDQDGDIDVVACIDTDPGNTGPVTIQYFENDGSGVFSTGQILGSLSANIQEVQARDFDLDGDMDVLFAESSNDQIGWIEQTAPGVFGTLEVSNTQVDGAQTIDVADIDQDGDNDVIAAGEYDDEWTYHINNGSETMLGDNNIGNGDNVSSICVADINGDAFPDAFAVYGIDGDVVWAAGNGNGFDAPQFILDGNGFPDNYPITIEANDLDQDGLVDAVVCSILNNEVSWFRNLGGGTFGSEQVIATGANNVRQTAVADFDGDGDLDVAAALFGSSQLVWYENTSPVSVSGCTDSTACNYDSNAVTDDGSCDYSCWGCTDSNSCNFDSTATIDDGSCEYDSCAGCMDSTACNFDSTATLPGTCSYDCNGCTLSIACNYSPEATVDDGSCEFTSCAGCQDANACDFDSSAIYPAPCDYSCFGCTDSNACNYDSGASTDNGTCTYSCFGCTDTAACNYESQASVDDGSCFYLDQVCGTGTMWDADLQMCIGTEVFEDPCPGDFNGDDWINTADLLEFLTLFNTGCE